MVMINRNQTDQEAKLILQTCNMHATFLSYITILYLLNEVKIWEMYKMTDTYI